MKTGLQYQVAPAAAKRKHTLVPSYSEDVQSTCTLTSTQVKMKSNGRSNNNNNSSSSSKKDDLVRYQRAIFTALFLGYACYTYNRKSVSYATPTLLASGLITTSNLGMIISSQNLAYAISKFLGGVLSDRVSAKVLFSLGLALSGGSTILFSRTEIPALMALLWFCNGFAQGAGWPACAKLLKKWFNPANFGTWWSVLTASSNVSGTLSPFIAAYIIINHGWSASLVLAGLVSLLMAGVTLITLVDDPTRVNLPDPTLSTQTSTSTPKEKKAESKDQNTTTSNNNMTVKELVTSPFLWVVSGCYLAVFCTKTALADWAQIYLMEELGRTQLQASSFTSAMETGGFFGGILAGILTDRLASKIRVRGNIRLMVASGFMLVCAVAVHVLRSFLTIHTSQIVVSGVGMVLGASMFGPISIYGIVASESFPAHLSGTAHAIVALAANVGAVAAGWPVSWVSRVWSWGGVLMVLQTLSAVSVVLILSTTSLHITRKAKMQ
ncbi:hypothetical protein Pmani_019014 [Petrolisthes manimaculis]|uniref:Major facilitator superfamily (MFS) profile domain-containing protein n=1 Tax=Petrolisthes manimaculis TaxID=1843537 RepID=A0AAE1PJS3_9EUCA|nr:hypothetical protein Pmani_019014 [Petrolisthes manimaculis]